MAVGVLVDANVLYSRTLRDWLFLLKLRSSGDLFRIYSTHDIVAEVLYRTRRRRPNAPGSLIRNIHDRIVDSLDDIVSNFEVDDSFTGDDPNDAHVHAATLACNASILLTDDNGFARFMASGDSDRMYEVHSPDSFFVNVDDSQAHTVRAVTLEQYSYWQMNESTKSLDAALRNSGCPKFATRVARHLVNLNLRAI